MKAIRVVWVAGCVGVAVASDFPSMTRLIVQAAGVLLCLVAWGAAICRAASRGEMRWVFLIALMPSITMWLYIFGRHGQQRRQSVPRAPHLARRMVVFPPLAVRQAQEVIEEAEDRYPDW